MGYMIDNTELVRLNKHLKDLGICSRRQADQFISDGLVLVNGLVVSDLGTKVNPKIDKVATLQQVQKIISEWSYILLNKPEGYVCSKSKVDGKNIFELLPTIKNLTYAGRLDKDSHGLVILSNDGKFVYSVAGSEFDQEKEYIVRIDKPVTEDYLRRQSNGSIMLDGKIVQRAKTKQIGENVYKITLKEGINRQIRRMAEVCDAKVIDLTRIRIGNIQDYNLGLGKWRNLTPTEINFFKK